MCGRLLTSGTAPGFETTPCSIWMLAAALSFTAAYSAAGNTRIRGSWNLPCSGYPCSVTTTCSGANSHHGASCCPTTAATVSELTPVAMPLGMTTLPPVNVAATPGAAAGVSTGGAAACVTAASVSATMVDTPATGLDPGARNPHANVRLNVNAPAIAPIRFCIYLPSIERSPLSPQDRRRPRNASPSVACSASGGCAACDSGALSTHSIL